MLGGAMTGIGFGAYGNLGGTAFVPLSTFMYSKYPVLKGAQIAAGHKIHKGPGVYFYITKDNQTVQKGLTGRTNTSLFRAGKQGSSGMTVAQGAEIATAIIGSGTAIYKTKLEADAARRAAAAGGPVAAQGPVYMPAPSSGNNTGLLIVGGLAVMAVIAAVVIMKR